MKKTFTNHYNYKPGRGNEVPQGVSLTVPDQSYSIRDILEKYTRGIAPLVAKEPIYDDDPDINNPDPLENPLDITDVQEALNNTNERIALNKSKLAKAKSQPISANKAAVSVQSEVTGGKEAETDPAEVEK